MHPTSSNNTAAAAEEGHKSADNLIIVQQNELAVVDHSIASSVGSSSVADPIPSLRVTVTNEEQLEIVAATPQRESSSTYVHPTSSNNTAAAAEEEYKSADNLIQQNKLAVVEHSIASSVGSSSVADPIPSLRVTVANEEELEKVDVVVDLANEDEEEEVTNGRVVVSEWEISCIKQLTGLYERRTFISDGVCLMINGSNAKFDAFHRGASEQGLTTTDRNHHLKRYLFVDPEETLLVYHWALHAAAIVHLKYGGRFSATTARFFPSLAAYKYIDGRSDETIVLLALGTVRCTSERLDGWIHRLSRPNAEPELVQNIASTLLRDMYVCHNENIDKKVLIYTLSGVK